MKKRVVITGMGAVTPIGNSVDEFWTNAKAGTVGIDEITKFSTADYKVKLAAELKDFDATAYMDRKEARRMDPFCQYAIAASIEAMKDSGLEVTEENADRIGVIIGSGIGGLGTIEAETKKLLEKGPGRVSPLMIPMAIGNMAAGNVAIRHGLKGKCTSVVTACATGTHSIGDAFRTIQYGEADAMLAGGCEAAITPLGLAGFMNLTALSESTDKNRASIPFDAKRDGFVMGEGAGVVVLEELEHAKARGAKIYAEIVGYGASCDAFHITSPMEDGSGAAKAMVEAIKEAGIEKEEVDYINAHGTSTPYNDLFETRAIKLAFGEYASKLAINSTKSMIGHLLGAAGGVEFIICVKSINDSYVHPTAGLQVADPECDLDYIAGNGRDMEVNYAISNSLGFGGHNASVIVKKYSE
ncbi:3-oxoacyl-[acyl-carrier-protein] synthase II [Anaerosporobacter mobilis DSM 15930]|uniref:3-oxoacyl-[acyl-carrier-protein] synthase 2 n=1 Tax=Anaerosporobacter mobilis DSM 15930 TaxID=1120996 RepID=A0A1M7GAG1_9FIRM|nr:beta-ketoacyl-ACP synthase II [Anaerosporobacter mobilis]SHM12917.1 3-oxoacyl-[acyl-carrier-protein] synthase II [Anaerosporobacter mobilis DSM 15930]